MSKSLTPKEQTTSSNAINVTAPTSCEEQCATPKLRLEYLVAATAGIALSTSATVGSMLMSTRAGADRQTSTRSRATPMRANHATQYRKEQSLSLFPSVIHGLFERNAAPAKLIAGSVTLNRYFRTIQSVLDSRWGKLQ